MFPSYQYTGPYFQNFPYQKEPNSYPCQYCSGWGSVRPSAFVPSPSHEFNQPNLRDHSGCCGHGFPPGYYGLSPQFCPNVQPPSHPHYYGPYLPYPSSYPAYFVPHPHNAVNWTQHDYDNTHSHCCRCPNSSCYRKGDTAPKIEEAVPEKELDRGSSGSDRPPNYSSPVVWVPVSSIKDREAGKDTQLQPGYLNGSVPLGIDGSKVSSQEEERKNENKWPQQSFPVIWMPGYDKPQEAVTNLKEITPGSVKEPEKLKIIPLKLLGNDDYEKNSRALEESKNEVQKEIPGEKESKTKTIPVKSMEERSQKKTSLPEVQEKKVDKEKATSFEKKTKEIEMHKKLEEERPSPVKSTKLRPVCLRVDPLPKKRMTNGASRSPSPPGHKDRKHHEELCPREGTGENTSERKHIVSVKDNGSSKSVEEQKCQENIHIPVGDPSKEPFFEETARTVGSETGGDKDSEGSNSAGSKNDLKMDADNEHERSSENKEVKEDRGTKRDLSQTDAAVIIQSAYRGFEVRKWQPLEKLRKIRKICEEADSIRTQVQTTGVSPEELGAKQKTFFGETLMNLLLQLDTIQGLHPSVRDIRKSVARELVLLQEKLDSLGCVEEKKPSSDEEETRSTAGGAAFASSDSLARSESLQDNISSIGSVVTPVELDVNSVDFSCDGGASLVASLSSLDETAEDNCVGKQRTLEYVQPAEENCIEKQPTAECVQPAETNCTEKQSTLEYVQPEEENWEYVQPEEENCTEKRPTLECVQPAGENRTENQPMLEYVQPALESVQPAEENCTDKQPMVEHVQPPLECVQPEEENCREKQPMLEYVQPAEENCTEEQPMLEYVQPAEENCTEKQPIGEYLQPMLECVQPAEENCTEKRPMLECVQPAGENCTEKQPVLEDVDCDRSNKSKHDVDSPTITSEPAQDTSIYLSVETDQACWHKTPSESASSGSKESDPKQKKLEKMARGKDDPIELAEFGEAPLLVTESDSKKDETIDTAEDNNLLSSGGSSPDRDVMKCLQPHQDVEVKRQEHEPVGLGAGAGDDSNGHSDATAVVKNVDDGICNSCILCTEEAMEIGNVEATQPGNLEAWATGTSEVTESNDENGLRVFADKIDGPPTSQLLPADKYVEDGIADFNESLSASSKDGEDHNGTDKSTLYANKYGNKEDRKLVSENEKLKDIVEKLLAAGKQHSDVISNLTGRVKDLERKLVQQKKKKKRRANVKPNRRVKALL
ncbi:uncharacterized protein A4U43_C01F26440 [Asparagus officinalis]|uniref:BAG domain-containing protein n=1 Tax=Asparagus officinalis TaxID=4686 RepID=A0A5P1FSA4_ASPOF|nr:uncharacterized protein LOC109828887 [Asparagus officinalis]ONK81205.1 uncharacterized protein A4U43_C01F26440 [Asparagus officinalis]